jgi:hypothetical protein
MLVDIGFLQKPSQIVDDVDLGIIVLRNYYSYNLIKTENNETNSEKIFTKSLYCSHVLVLF